MKHLFCYLLGFGLSFFTCFPNLKAQSDKLEMTYNIRAIANESPTSYVLTLPMSAIGITVEEADSKIKNSLKALTKDLQSLQADQIHTEFVSIKPIYKKIVEKSKKSTEPDLEIGEERIAYEYRQNVRIVYTQDQQLPKIMLAAAKQNIFEIADIQYRHNKGEKVFANLRNKCIDYMRQNLPQYEDMGFEILDWQRYTEEERIVFYPNENMNVVLSEVVLSQPYITDKINTTVYDRKPSEYKFSKRNGVEDYHIVVNPDLLEPAIQFVYVFKVKIVVPNENQKIEYKNEFTFPAKNSAPTYMIPFVPQD